MNTFTARFETPSGNRIVTNCTIYKGKVVQITSVGVGKPTYKAARNEYGDFDEWEEYSSYTDKLRPYLNSFLVGNNKEQIKAKLDRGNGHLTAENEDEILQYCFTLGKNEGGYNVVNMDEEKKQVEEKRMQSMRKREITIIVKEGHFGMYLSDRLPPEEWKMVKHLAKYWSKEDVEEWFEDMDDFGLVKDARFLVGWYFQKEIVSLLQEIGYTVEQK